MARRPEVIAVLGRAVRTPRGTAGLVIAGLVVLVAAIGPAVAPYSATEFVTAPFARASSVAWLGGDVLGRDPDFGIPESGAHDRGHDLG